MTEKKSKKCLKLIFKSERKFVKSKSAKCCEISFLLLCKFFSFSKLWVHQLETIKKLNKCKRFLIFTQFPLLVNVNVISTEIDSSYWLLVEYKKPDFDIKWCPLLVNSSNYYNFLKSKTKLLHPNLIGSIKYGTRTYFPE